MAETVLVTGGTGFVAGWCIVDLLQRNYIGRTTVRSLSREAAVRAALARAGVSADAGERLSFVVADLMSDAGWDAAMAGCDYVLHVASPLGANAADPQALIGPARDGTLRVLGAATCAGVRRVVMTSGATAARPRFGSGAISDETVWTDPEDRDFDSYRLSKILAERAAWDFMATSGSTTELTTVLPGAVFGPVLTRDNLGSVQIIDRLMSGRVPRLPRFGFWVVDVRDLADLHVRAMTAPQAGGERFLAFGDFMWLKDIATTLRTTLGMRAEKVPTRSVPDFVIRLMGLFNPDLKMLVTDLGRKNPATSDKARRVLGFAPRPAAETIVDCANSLVVDHP